MKWEPTESKRVDADNWIETRNQLSAMEWLEEFGFVVDRHELDFAEPATRKAASKKAA
jgi:hypothetical protein